MEGRSFWDSGIGGNCRAISLADGRIYCRDENGTLKCYQIGSAGSPPADGDGDGMADQWEELHFAGTNSCAPLADPDGDSSANLDEYVAGTDPTNAASVFRIHITGSSDAAVVTWQTIAADGVGYENLERYYCFEDCADLPAAAWTGVDGMTHVLGSGQLMAYTNTSLDSTCFYRVRVTLE
jgi:hypothetical protein